VRVAIIGANGQVGRALMSAFADCEVVPITRAECSDVGDRAAVRAALQMARPDVVLLTAAHVDADGAERDPGPAYRTNALGARWVAQEAQALGAGVLYFSSDYVFPGDGGAPYHEWAPTRPLSVYGQSKLAGEAETFRHAERAWVVRTSWIFGGEGKTFVNTMRRLLAAQPQLDVVADEVGSPTYAPDLAGAVRQLVDTGAPGLYHLANEGECSRYEWARTIGELAGLPGQVRATTTPAFRSRYPNSAPRPAHSTLANTAAAALGVTLRPWRDALAEHLCASR
jgi:dTDP-4-dehydrorhamnose reductase